MNKIALVMGSKSDWATMKHCADQLDALQIGYDKRVVSAHRTPDLMFTFAEEAEANGLSVIIAAAGGAAHLPGMLAAKTAVPVIGVPVSSSQLSGVDSLLSIVQMPAGVPVMTMSIGRAGAVNAALAATGILALHDPHAAQALQQFRRQQTEHVLNNPDPSL